MMLAAVDAPVCHAPCDAGGVRAIGRKFSGPCGGWKASTNIAQVLTRRVHSAGFARGQIFDQKSRKIITSRACRRFHGADQKTAGTMRIPARVAPRLR